MTYLSHFKFEFRTLNLRGIIDFSVTWLSNFKFEFRALDWSLVLLYRFFYFKFKFRTLDLNSTTDFRVNALLWNRVKKRVKFVVISTAPSIVYLPQTKAMTIEKRVPNVLGNHLQHVRKHKLHHMRRQLHLNLILLGRGSAQYTHIQVHRSVCGYGVVWGGVADQTFCNNLSVRWVNFAPGSELKASGMNERVWLVIREKFSCFTFSCFLWKLNPDSQCLFIKLINNSRHFNKNYFLVLERNWSRTWYFKIYNK